MKSTIVLTTALLIGTPTTVQSQVVQSIEGRVNATNSIINTNNLNGNKNKKAGIYDDPNTPDCTKVDIGNLSLGSMIITKIAEGRQGGVEIIGFHKDFSCVMTGANNLKVGDIIIGIWGSPIKNPADLSKILNKSNPGVLIPIIIYDKDWKSKEIILETVIRR